MLNKFKFVDQGKSFYAERPDRKNALGLHLCHMFTPFLLLIYVKGEKEGGGGKKTCNFCLATGNEARYAYMGILTIGPFN
jgi:hypothetical protein